MKLLLFALISGLALYGQAETLPCSLDLSGKYFFKGFKEDCEPLKPDVANPPGYENNEVPLPTALRSAVRLLPGTAITLKQTQCESLELRYNPCVNAQCPEKITELDLVSPESQILTNEEFLFNGPSLLLTARQTLTKKLLGLTTSDVLESKLTQSDDKNLRLEVKTTINDKPNFEYACVIKRVEP